LPCKKRYSSKRENSVVPVIEKDELDFDEEIIQQGELISDRLNMLRLEQYPPDAQKGLRLFSLAEVADFIGVTQNHIKKLHLDGKGPVPTVSSSGRRSYTAEQMLELRQYLDKHGRSDVKYYVPRRRDGEHLQVISVVNFKGGSERQQPPLTSPNILPLRGTAFWPST
jgi:chromosome partitioning protein